MEIKECKITSFKEFNVIVWNKIKPYKNPTLTRMLTISTGVFTALDLTEAVATQKYCTT